VTTSGTSLRRGGDAVAGSLLPQLIAKAMSMRSNGIRTSEEGTA